ncbi:MAG TPA: CocE/NonD family hydrolase, partial [Acidimicrobiales bacterium]|nr:CocE/NonD family hydrolase [Acidimicrobiales bacterium]
MRLRRPARLLVVALFASLLSPVAFQASPAVAHGVCTPNADDATADFYPATSPWSDGVKVRIRVLRPVNCAGKPGTGWPLIVHLHGGSGNRCTDIPFYSRYETAQHGFVVLSFTARGKPGPLTVGAASKGCDDTEDGYDALDDPGSDSPGPRDLKDISELITWLANNNSFTGCSNPCADTNKVGVTGFSWGGPRTLWMGVQGPPGHATHAGPNHEFDDRVKAIAPVGSQVLWRTMASQNNDGAATPVARDRAGGTWGNIAWWFNQGWFGHWTREYSKHAGELDRASFLNQTL